MKPRLVVSQPLRDFLRHLPPELKRRMKQVLAEIIENPKSGKALSEELTGLRSYKFGKLRIVYREKISSIELVAVGPRKTIYQKVALEIKRVN